MRIKNMLLAIITAVVVLTASAFYSCVAQQEQPTKEHKTHGKGASHDKEMDEMNRRGEREMGFSQASTVHHFRVLTDGGAIEAEAKDEKDTGTVDRIRGHLRHIAQLFSEGNFQTPMLIHSEMPPGVPVMQQLKAEIRYQFEDLARGGRVRITTVNAQALKAIHEFLRFQITEHETGDALEVKEKSVL